MASKYQYQETGGYTGWKISKGSGANQFDLAQTFTPQIDHTLSKIELKLFRTSIVDKVTLELRATDGEGKPLGDDNPYVDALASKTVDVSAITTDSAGEWIEFIFNTPVDVVAGTTYAIVGMSNVYTGANYITWVGTLSSSYTRGYMIEYDTLNEKWDKGNDTWDLEFREYGQDLTKYEAKSLQNSNFYINASNKGYGQTFTPSILHNIVRVNLILARYGLPGDVIVSIKATDEDGKPTGDDLTSTVIDGDVLSTDAIPSSTIIIFPTYPLLEGDTIYAICVRCPAADTDNYVRLRYFSSDVYAGGAAVVTTDGINWDFASAGIYDCWFAEYGGNFVDEFTRFEYYNTVGDELDGFNDSIWEAQTFTPQTNVKLELVRLRIYRASGNDPGTVTISIKATDEDGKPTGDDLISTTLVGTNLPEFPFIDQVNIIFDSSITLSAGVKYAVVVRCDGVQSMNWRAYNPGTYSNGNACFSTDSGSIWTAQDWAPDNTIDCDFEIYGEEVSAPEITDQPDSQTVHVGELVTLLVIATGKPAPTYQWKKNDVTIEGETNSSLGFYAEESDEGNYTCEVSNDEGDVTSDIAVVTVNPNLYNWNPFNLNIDIGRED